MLIPIGDEPGPRHLPPATAALLVINALVYVMLTIPLAVARPALDDPAVADYRETDVSPAEALTNMSATPVMMLVEPGSSGTGTRFGSASKQ